MQKIGEFFGSLTMPIVALRHEIGRFFSTSPAPMPAPAAFGRAIAFLVVVLGAFDLEMRGYIPALSGVFVLLGMLFLVLVQNYIRGIALDMNPPTDDSDDQR